MTVPWVDIPPFNDSGNLPDGVYPCNESAVQHRFVSEFPNSQTRHTVFAGFQRFRTDAETHGISGTQWVNGSFVTSKRDPADVDVVTFCDYIHLNKLNATAQGFVLQ